MNEKYYQTTNPSSRMIETQSSPRFTNRPANSQVSLTANEVSRIINSDVREGEAVKGKSRINYVPYEKKVVEYQERQYVEKVPVKRKVIEYEERKVVEEVPREVIKTDYYAVENIKQYYKEIIPEKKIQMVPVERKVKKIQYVPVERQIIHYPEGQKEDEAKGKSRLILQQQGVAVKPDAQYRPIDPRLIYEYTNNSSNMNNPVGYVEDGNHRFLSTSPSYRSGEQTYFGSPRFENAQENYQHPYSASKGGEGFFPRQ